MTKEKELALVEKYPKILKDYGGDMRLTCMSWGMECGDGWYDLLDNCMGRIQNICDKSGAVQLIAAQIKEKFGGLRFYYNIQSAEGNPKDTEDVCRQLSDIVSEAEELSCKTCERCGKNGESRSNNGWISTSCEEHKN